jgi:serine/threonine protein kinase/WD40 repeat protein
LIEKYLGGGGFGDVYLAKSSELGGRVAIKILKPRFSQDVEITTRFEREIQTAHQNRHPAVVQFLFCGVCNKGLFDNCKYLVFEYLSGGDLRTWMSNHRVDSREQLRIAVDKMISVCNGLVNIHGSGVIHRDIKPENILLDADGNAKLADFGLVTFLDRQRADNLTQTGQLLGTIQYMAPEQILNPRNASEKSDIYSIGIILYELLCQLRPWQAVRPVDVQAKRLIDDERLKEEERIRSNVKSLPETPSSKLKSADRRLQDIAMRCLDPEPSFRYANASQLKESLEAWQRGEPDPHTKAWLKRTLFNKVIRPIRQKPLRNIAVVSLFITLVAGAYGFLNRLSYENALLKKNNELSAANLKLENSIEFETNLRQQAVGKDLANKAIEQLVVMDNPEGALQLALQAVEVRNPPPPEAIEMLASSLQATQSVGTIPNYKPLVWSQNSENLILKRREFIGKTTLPKIIVTDVNGNITGKCLDGDLNSDRRVIAEWSSTSDHFLLVEFINSSSDSDCQITLFNRAGSEKYLQLSLKGKVWSKWSPGGNHFAIYNRTPAENINSILIYDTNGKVIAKHDTSKEELLPLDWISDSSLVFVDYQGKVSTYNTDGQQNQLFDLYDINSIHPSSLRLIRSCGNLIYTSKHQTTGKKQVHIEPLTNEDEIPRRASLEQNFERFLWSSNEEVFVLVGNGHWRAFDKYANPLSDELKIPSGLDQIAINPLGYSILFFSTRNPTAELISITGTPVATLRQLIGSLTLAHAVNWPDDQGQGTDEAINNCIWSPTGEHIITLGPKNAVLWDSDGFAMTTLEDKDLMPPADVNWSPQGDLFTCSYPLTSVIQVRTAQGNAAGVLRGMNGLPSVSWSSTGNRIALAGELRNYPGSDPNGTKVFRSTEEPAARLHGHFQTQRRGVVAEMAWSPTENILATGVRYLGRLPSIVAGERQERRQSKTLGIYREQKERITEENFPNPSKPVYELNWSTSGKYLLALVGMDEFRRDVSQDRRNLIVMEKNGAISADVADVHTCVWHPTEELIAVGFSNRVALLKPDGTVLSQLATETPVDALSWSPSGMDLVATLNQKAFCTLLLKRYSDNSLALHRTINEYGTVVGWSNQSDDLFVSKSSGKYVGMDPYIKQMVYTPIFFGLTRLSEDGVTSQIKLPTYCTDAAISPSGNYAAFINTTNHDQPEPIYLWKRGSEKIEKLYFHIGVHRIAWAPGNERDLLVSAGDDGKVCFWDPETGLLAVAEDENDRSSPVLELAWSPNGQLVATADTNNSVRVWNRYGRKVVAFQEDRKAFSIASMNSTSRQSRPHREILEQDFHHLSWSPDGHWLAVCNNSPEPRLFSTHFSELYSRAHDVLQITPFSKRMENSSPWNPSTTNWFAESSVKSNEKLEMLDTFFSERQLDDILADIEQFILTRRYMTAESLIHRALSRWPRSSELWKSLSILEDANGNPKGSAQALMVCFVLGDKSNQVIESLLKKMLERGWIKSALDLIHGFGLASTDNSEIVEKLLIEEFIGGKGSIARELTAKTSLEELLGLSLTQEQLSLMDRYLKRSKNPLTLRILVASQIAAAFNHTNQWKWMDAAKHQQDALQAIERLDDDSKKDVFNEWKSIQVYLEKGLKFNRSVSGEKTDENDPLITGNLSLLKAIRSLENKDAKIVIEECTRIVESSESNSLLLLRFACVASAMLKDSSNLLSPNALENTLASVIIKLLDAYSKQTESKSSPSSDDVMNMVFVGSICTDPFFDKTRAIEFIVSNLISKLDESQTLHLLENSRLGIDKTRSATLLVAVAKSPTATSLTRDALSAAGQSLREESPSLATECFQQCLLLSTQDSAKSSDVESYCHIELGRLFLAAGDPKVANEHFGRFFGSDKESLESEYKSLMSKNRQFNKLPPLSKIWLLWMQSLRDSGDMEKYSSELPHLLTFFKSMHSEKSDYFFLEDYAFVIRDFYGSPSESLTDTISRWELLVSLCNQASKVMPRMSLRGGVPVDGFAGFANPMAFRYHASIELGELKLKNSNYSAAEELATMVVNETKNSNWYVADYYNAYLKALNLQARILLANPSPTWATRAGSVNTALRLCRNDGFSNPAYLETLAAAYAACGQYTKASTFQEKVVRGVTDRQEAIEKLDRYRKLEVSTK